MIEEKPVNFLKLLMFPKIPGYSQTLFSVVFFFCFCLFKLYFYEPDFKTSIQIVLYRWLLSVMFYYQDQMLSEGCFGQMAINFSSKSN